MSNFVLDFAGPTIYTSLENHSLFASAYQHAMIKNLQRHAADHIELHTLLESTILPALDSISPTAYAWQPELGALVSADNKGQTHEACIHAVLALAALRVPIECSLPTRARMRASLGGHLFDLAGPTHLSSDGTRILIVSHSPAVKLELHWQGERWVREPIAIATTWRYAAPYFAGGAGMNDIYIQVWEEPQDGREEIVAEWPLPSSQQIDQLRQRDAGTVMGAALNVIEQCGPRYIPWIRQLLRGVAATSLSYDDMRQSGSYLAHAGVFNCGFPGAAESIAEVIVHEVSHQNFLLLNSIYRLCDDHLDGQMYSSLKRKHRTLSRILFAYHAAANMALFWADLGKTRPLSDYYLREQNEMNGHAVDLYLSAQNAKGFTAEGRIFFDALTNRLCEEEILVRSDRALSSAAA